MRIYNSDGSEPEMCGNGIRCLARFVADVDEKKNGKSSTPSSGSPANANANSTAAVATGAGIIRPEVLSDGLIRVDMGPPTLSPALVPTTLASTGKSSPFEQSALDAVVAGEVRSGGDTWLVTCVSMGNPHAVTFGKSDGSAIEDVDAVDLAGPGAEMVRLFYDKVFSCPLSFFLFRVRLEAADENSTHALSLSLSLSLFSPSPLSLFPFPTPSLSRLHFPSAKTGKVPRLPGQDQRRVRPGPQPFALQDARLGEGRGPHAGLWHRRVRDGRRRSPRGETRQEVPRRLARWPAVHRVGRRGWGGRWGRRGYCVHDGARRVGL